ncbi:MAG: 4-aminobutyrate--2-oxoglutarate transaminase, partial [Pantoea agglomerans]
STAQAVQKMAMEQGLLLLTCGAKGNVIRFLYPLTIPDTQFSQALTILSTVIAHCVAPAGHPVVPA